MIGRKCIKVDIRLQGRLQTTSVIVYHSQLICPFVGHFAIQAAGAAKISVEEGFHSGDTGSYDAQ